MSQKKKEQHWASTSRYDTGELLRDLDGSADAYSLEEILAEYGHGGLEDPTRPEEQKAMAETEPTQEPVREEKAAPAPKPAPEQPRWETKAPEQEPLPQENPEEPEEAEEPQEEERVPDLEIILPEEALPRPPRPISVEEVVGRTVESLMAEPEPLKEKKQRRRFLFSRRPMMDTEEFYDSAAPEPEPEPEPLEPEPPLTEVADSYRELRGKLGRPLPWAVLVTLVMAALMALDYSGLEVPLWTGQVMVQSMTLLVMELMVCFLCRAVFWRGFHALFRKRVTPALLVSLAAVTTVADCATRPFLEGRCQALPFSAVAAMGLCFALWGCRRETAGLYECYRTAAMDDEPPYLVTDTPEGACKQHGTVEGFFYMAESESIYARHMAVMLPVILTATVVFALLASVGQRRGADFLWCWSALLTAAAGFALPLAYSLPFSRLAKRLHKSGAAVAGYAGAERVCRKRAMILTDSDLFPPGTVTLNGMKLFGEQLSKVVSYADSLARASGSGLVRLFDGLMSSEGGHTEPVEDFSFYEEGGVSGTIHGETVLLGTASFLRKMDVRLPGNINLRTGVYLAVDRQLVAVFAVKYLASENVEWALKSMKRGRITPILAVRDGNLTPALIKRKFGGRMKVVYPELSARLALSEQEAGTGRPDALLFREGLMPYAEAVAGSRRYTKTARRCTFLSVLGSVAGLILAFYLSFSAAYALLTPLALLVFLLLWTVPVFLLSGWVDRF